MTNVSREQVLSYIENLSLIEIKVLVNELKERLGVDDVPAYAQPTPVDQSNAVPEPEPTEFAVILKSFGDKKVAVIREVRSITGLGLKESKDLVESAPAAVKEAVDREEAEALKAQLEEAGAMIELE